MNLLTRSISLLLTIPTLFSASPRKLLNNAPNEQPDTPPALVSTELPPSRTPIKPPLETEEYELSQLLNKLQLTTENPTTDEIFNALNKFAEEKQGIESELNIKNIISSIKTNTEKHFEDNKDEPSINSYVPGLTSKDYKKLDYIYNIQKQIETELKKQLNSKFENASPYIKSKLSLLLSNLTFVSKYSRTDEDINKIGYYDQFQNTLVIFPDNIQELCINENIQFEKALEIFIANFINYLEQTIYNPSFEIEPITISCIKETETPTIGTTETKEISLLLLLNKSGKNIDCRELEKIILERDISKLYQVLGATTIIDVHHIDQAIAALANKKGEISILKDLVITKTNDNQIGLAYLFENGIELITKHLEYEQKPPLEYVQAIYSLLKNLIAKQVNLNSLETCDQVMKRLQELDTYFINVLSTKYNLKAEEIKKNENSGPQLKLFINVINAIIGKNTTNKETITPEEQEQISTIIALFPELNYIIPPKAYPTPFDWEYNLKNWEKLQQERLLYSVLFNPPEINTESRNQSTPLYTYTYDQTTPSEDTLQDQTDYTTDPTIKYDFHISKRNTKN